MQALRAALRVPEGPLEAAWLPDEPPERGQTSKGWWCRKLPQRADGERALPPLKFTLERRW